MAVDKKTLRILVIISITFIIYFTVNLLIAMTAGLRNVVGGSFVGLVSIPMSLQVTTTDDV